MLWGMMTACASPKICNEPLDNNRQIFRAINQMLQSLIMDPADYTLTIKELESRLQQEPCVRKVEFDETIVATEPAILYGRLTLGTGEKVVVKKLTLRFSGHRIWLEKME